MRFFTYGDILLLYILTLTTLSVGSILLSSMPSVSRYANFARMQKLNSATVFTFSKKAPALFLLHAGGIFISAVFPAIIARSGILAVLLGFLYGVFVFGNQALIESMFEKKAFWFDVSVGTLVSALLCAGVSFVVYGGHLVFL